MTNHYDEEAQAEQLKRWWKENWQSLVAGLAIGLAVIFGWQTWQNHKLAEAGVASHLFEDMKKALEAGKHDEAVSQADQLVREHSGSPYAAAAALLLAKKALEDNHAEEALARLNWVTEHSDDAGIKALVRLRTARVQWQQGKTDDALKTLDGDAGTYGGLYDELRGDIKLAKGDRAGAAAAYQKALTAASAAEPHEGPDRDALQKKLDDLADVATPPAPVAPAAPVEAES